MQMFANAITRYIRSLGLWAWSHLHNFLLAHNDLAVVANLTNYLFHLLQTNGIHLNLKDTVLMPTQQIKFLGFHLDGARQTLAHTAS